MYDRQTPPLFTFATSDECEAFIATIDPLEEPDENLVVEPYGRRFAAALIIAGERVLSI